MKHCFSRPFWRIGALSSPRHDRHRFSTANGILLVAAFHILGAFSARADWVAYHDLWAGPGTHPNTTVWNPFGTAMGGAPTSGPLTNIQTGARLAVTLTGSYSGDGRVSSTAGVPAAGTPAYLTFNGYVDWNTAYGSGSVQNTAQFSSAGAVTWTFTGLNPARRYSLKGAMMYDAQYLYIAARVGDPMPMRNVIDPNVDPWSAWMGGGLHLHLCTDRTFGWPLKAQWPPSGRQASAQDISERIVHLFLWYFQPREQPCLSLRYGMKMERGVVNPPEWSGAFRKASDGHSYTLECAIPWTLLGAGSDPPRAGDVLGLSWTVEWSDASGRRWKGQLVEIKNPPYADRGKEVLTFMNAEAWGKAIYR